MATVRQFRPISVEPTSEEVPSFSSTQETAQTEIFRRAAEVIGNDEEAMRWMGTPVRDLNYATPISLLHDPQGLQSVLTVLGRLEHGVL